MANRTSQNELRAKFIQQTESYLSQKLGRGPGKLGNHPVAGTTKPRASWLTWLLSIASVLILAVSVSASQPWAQDKQNLTVITHGLTFGEQAPAWTNKLASVLRQQQMDCLVTNWAKASTTMKPGLACTAGEKLASRLLDRLERTKGKLHLHFIGFSRGTVVNSIAQRTLEAEMDKQPELRTKLGNVMVTMLDPHPANGKVGFFAPSGVTKAMTKAFERVCNDPFPQLGRTTTEAFVYFQQATPKDASVNPFGWAEVAKKSPLVRARKNLTGVVVEGKPIEHLTVPAWYIRQVSSESPILLVAEKMGIGVDTE